MLSQSDRTAIHPATGRRLPALLLTHALNAILALLILLLGTAWSAAFAAQGAGPAFKHPSEAGRGELLYRDKDSGLFRAVPLLATEVEIGIGGVSARVTVLQRFKSTSPDWLEGVYVFPLPDTAAVDFMRMSVGGRTIEGRVAERRQAKKEFDRARDSGRRASLVEQERANVFTASVANIAPGEEIEVRLGYAQTVERDAAGFRLRFPMVVGPRYIPGLPLVASAGGAAATNRVPDADRISPPVAHPSAGPINPVEIAVKLDPGFPVARVNSPFHAIDSKQQVDGTWRIALADGAVPADRDFELEWFPTPSAEPLARVFAETEADGRYVLLTVMPPVAAAAATPSATADAPAPSLPREAVFVVDTSGSMHGESIVQAKQALALALARLRPTDMFNVIEFNSRARRLFARAEPAAPEFLRRAQAWVGQLKAEGGTEMRQALDLALDGNTDPSRLRQIVFLTDGAVGDDEALLQQVRGRLGDSRLFTIGIGSAPNGYFMRKAAEVGRGSAVFIGKPEQVAERMELLFRRLEHPAVTDLAVRWPGNAAADALPDPLPDLYAGEPVVVAAKLPVGVAGPVALSGKIAGQPWRTVLTLGANDDVAAGIPALWAGRKVEALDDSVRAGAPADEVRLAIVQVALRHNLVTKHTSLVAVDVTPARPEAAPLQGGAMPTNLPKGWDYAAVFGGAGLGLPQTATPAALLMITGTALIGMAGFILVVARRRRTAVEE